jgi:diguanylate cyclase (GGDEF)-like protein/PAS domain S-box-containing protein
MVNRPRKTKDLLGREAEHRTIEKASFIEKGRAEYILECIGDAVMCTDILGDITFLNRAAENMTGWLLKEVAGRAMTETFPIVESTTRIVLNPIAKAALENQMGRLPENCVLIHRDGHEVFIEGFAAPIRDHDGQVTGAIIVFRDVSAARALVERLVHSAQHDPLTGLPNRALLIDRVDQAIALALRQKGQVALFFIDLDDFKRINDSLGHAIGDKLLQSVAKRLIDCVRTPDTVSRQGGDEFVVLLQEVHQAEDVANAARRLLEALAETHSIDHLKIHVTASIGISLYPSDGKDADTLLKNADAAMYQAKQNGRESYQYFEPDINVHAVERQSLDQDLRHALERNEFKLHYQHKIDLKMGTIIGAEALSRWIHPTRGLVLPGQFIPDLERSGLILPVGGLVLREACRQARMWADAGMPARTMCVNVSGIQLRSEGFLEGLFATLSVTGLDPESLELDVAESILARDPEQTRSILKTLKDRGVHVSLDDFGMGFSSLNSLRKLPLDALKIDRSLIRRITSDPDGETFVSAIIRIGQSLNLRVVAEGVETIKDLEFLWAHGCDEAQGYYFGRPVPPEQFGRLLQAQ